MSKVKHLTEFLMGIDRKLVKPNLCAYRIRLDQMIDRDQDIDKESPCCIDCTGYPQEGCISYTTLDHILDTYRLFKNEVNI